MKMTLKGPCIDLSTESAAQMRLKHTRIMGCSIGVNAISDPISQQLNIFAVKLRAIAPRLSFRGAT
jgi:hypothetical protein